MKFIPTALAGVYVIEQERREDTRGFFARTFCRDEFAAHGLETAFVQCNTSYNKTRNTLRGMHYQADPHGEAKLVRCTRGAMFDVIVDVRPVSATYCQWVGVEITEDDGRMIYIPVGYAHGFQTLADDTEVFYQMSGMYVASAARGVRWNDPALGIRWPQSEPLVSERDAAYPDIVR